MTVMNIFSLLGGLGLFLFGMRIMGEGLERAAGNRLRRALCGILLPRLQGRGRGCVPEAAVRSTK